MVCMHFLARHMQVILTFQCWMSSCIPASAPNMKSIILYTRLGVFTTGRQGSSRLWCYSNLTIINLNALPSPNPLKPQQHVPVASTGAPAKSPTHSPKIVKQILTAKASVPSPSLVISISSFTGSTVASCNVWGWKYFYIWFALTTLFQIRVHINCAIIGYIFVFTFTKRKKSIRCNHNSCSNWLLKHNDTTQ